MQFVYPTNKHAFALVIGVKSEAPIKMIVEAKDDRKPATYYIRRKGDVDGYREFELKFPQSPNTTVVSIYNVKNGNIPEGEDKTFIITKFEVRKLKVDPIVLRQKDINFIKFAKEFSESASILSSGDKKPSVYRSDDGAFYIDYYNVIKDRKTGRVMNTPARVGHNTGIIEVSKNSFYKYTVPMRMIILLHEYSHKHKNTELKRPIGDETAADINALNMYLAMGYPDVEALQAFLYVFKGANNDANHKRYKIILDFVRKYKSGELQKQFNVRK